MLSVGMLVKKSMKGGADLMSASDASRKRNDIGWS